MFAAIYQPTELFGQEAHARLPEPTFAPLEIMLSV
jgi:hypothetical protein